MEIVHLTKAPEHTTRGGLHWGAWDGKLAIVDLYEDRFDCETLERAYVVRFAVDLFNREPMLLSARALERSIGLPVNVREPSKLYEKTEFMIGSRQYNPREFIHGSFAPPVTFRVKVSLKEMSDGEHFALARSLRSRGFTRIETKKSGAQVRALLARSFSDLQDDHYEVANEADRILRDTGYNTSASDEGCNFAWARLRKNGVFVEARNGRVKWYLNPEGE